MIIGPNSKLVMIGDSITDCGRNQPVGEAFKDGLGNGYVNLVNAVLSATYPSRNIRVVNTGMGGDTVLDLAARWEQDVITLEPDWLSIMIGINDVWRQFDSPLQREEHVSINEYVGTLEKLVAETRPRLKGLVLMSPYFIEPNKSEPMRAMMGKYGAAVQQVAGRHHAVYVDTQAAFDSAMKYIHPMTLAWDRVHPSQTGHMILARAFLNAIGYTWK